MSLSVASKTKSDILTGNIFKNLTLKLGVLALERTFNVPSDV
jgi:hypothetical protein